MNWLPIVCLAEELHLSKPTLKLRADINGRVARLLAGRQKLDALVAERLERDPASMTPEQMAEEAMFPAEIERGELMRLLGEELAARTQFAEFYAARQADRMEARQSATDALDAARARIEKLFEDAGWHRYNPSEMDPCRWLPVFRESHPDVRAAREAVESLASLTADDPQRRENEALKNRLLAEIQRRRASAAAA